MKTVLFLLLILIASNSTAQTTVDYARYNIGLHSGITSAYPNKYLKTYYKASGLNGYSIGLSFNFALSKYVSFEFRPSVATVRYNSKTWGGHPFVIFTYTNVHTQCYLPLFADFHNSNRIRFHAYVGGFYSQLINSKTNTINDNNNYETTTDDTQSYYDDDNAGGGGFIFGGGIGFHPKLKGVTVVLQYLYYMHIENTWLEHGNLGLNLLYSF